MGDATEHLLATLGLLQSRARWTAAELAAAAQLSETTVRRHVARLRDWGVQIETDPGPRGGYRLVPGRSLPPLVLDDEQAAAVAIALRRALLAPAPVAEEGTLRAMATLAQVLPARVRESVAAHDGEVSVEAQAMDRRLAVVAEGLRSSRVVAFRDSDGSGPGTPRQVEPLVVRARAGQWFLMGYDRDINRIATWPIARLQEPRLTGIRFSERRRRARSDCEALPDDLPSPVVAVIDVGAPARQVRSELAAGVGFIEPIDEDSCRVLVSDTTVGAIARRLLLLREPFTVVEPEELRAELRAIGRALAAV